MDNMRISGTEPSSVILNKTKQFKKLKSETIAPYSKYFAVHVFYRRSGCHFL